MQTIGRDAAEHYTWGGPLRSQRDGWHPVKTRELEVFVLNRAVQAAGVSLEDEEKLK